MSAAGRARGTPGFTLIEVMAVTLIFALLVALLAPRVGALTGRRLHQRAEQIAAQLELARQRAVVTGIRHRMLFDLESGGYRMEGWSPEEGSEVPAGAAPLDLRGQAAIPLEAPRDATVGFHRLPGKLGDFEWLEDEIAFEGLEGEAGWIGRGDASVDFEPDGSATASEIHLSDETGRVVFLEVLPLADGVRIADAQE